MEMRERARRLNSNPGREKLFVLRAAVWDDFYPAVTTMAIGAQESRGVAFDFLPGVHPRFLATSEPTNCTAEPCHIACRNPSPEFLCTVSRDFTAAPERSFTTRFLSGCT